MRGYWENYSLVVFEKVKEHYMNAQVFLEQKKIKWENTGKTGVLLKKICSHEKNLGIFYASGLRMLSLARVIKNERNLSLLESNFPFL